MLDDVWRINKIRSLATQLGLFVTKSLRIYDSKVNKRLLYEAKDEASLLRILEDLVKQKDISDDDPYVYKTEPYQHQKDCFMYSRDHLSYAIFAEQGTGKSKITIDSIAYLYEKGLINAVLIIAPNGVKPNWRINEIPTHMPDRIPYETMEWFSTQGKLQKAKYRWLLEEDLGNTLKIMVANVEAMVTEKFNNYAKKFLDNHKTMMVIDESSRIKNPSARRTKNAIMLGGHADYKRILTGTPVTQGPFDVYSQFKFLDPEIIKFRSYTAFKTYYAVIREAVAANGGMYEFVAAYRNMDDLINTIKPYSYRILKKDCLDLPDKIYERCYVELSPEQKRIYGELEERLIAKIEGGEMSASVILTQLLRLQQTIGGFYKLDDEEEIKPIPGKNPRLNALIELCDDHLQSSDTKIIIWARFKNEIRTIHQALTKKFGRGTSVMYYGEVNNADRVTAMQDFQDKTSPVKFFVANAAAAGMGLTLTASDKAIYYSNSFSLEDRLQSEDRQHRIGQTNNVVYIDMEAPNTIDTRIIKALREKKELADLITEDPKTLWI